MFLQIATEFASVGSVILPSQPIQLAGEEKLAALRRIDKDRPWNSLDDQFYCTICKTLISGRQIEVVGGTNVLRALHLKCSTPGCLSTPAARRLTGSCPSNRTLSARLTSFFVTTAFEPLIHPSTKSKCRRRPGFRHYCSLTLTTVRLPW